jgi:hypothetical protein
MRLKSGRAVLVDAGTQITPRSQLGSTELHSKSAGDSFASTAAFSVTRKLRPLTNLSGR